MMKPDGETPAQVLRRLAEAITDESLIDWDLEASSHPELASDLQQLRLIERINVAHRAHVVGTSGPRR
jgi:hypothetical protein